MTPAVKSGIDVSQIPRVDVTNLSRTTLSAVRWQISEPCGCGHYRQMSVLHREEPEWSGFPYPCEGHHPVQG
jgi:hypothetical protein